jgi:hypothetical protein
LAKEYFFLSFSAFRPPVIFQCFQAHPGQDGDANLKPVCSPNLKTKNKFLWGEG